LSLDSGGHSSSIYAVNEFNLFDLNNLGLLVAIMKQSHNLRTPRTYCASNIPRPESRSLAHVKISFSRLVGDSEEIPLAAGGVTPALSKPKTVSKITWILQQTEASVRKYLHLHAADGSSIQADGTQPLVETSWKREAGPDSDCEVVMDLFAVLPEWGVAEEDLGC